jgi:hypothetical protein
MAAGGFITYIYNISQIGLWTIVIFLNLNNVLGYMEMNKTDAIITQLRIAQSLQAFDIVLNLLKLTKGSLLGSVMQIIGRLSVAWLILDHQTDHKILLNVLIPWALSDIIRYSYYLTDSTILGHLR